MRLVLVTALAALLAAPALAAELDPKALALRQTDVPAGFRLDAADSGLRTNAGEAKSEPRLRALYARWGRVTGYESEFDRGSESISSRIDVLRTSRGARMLLEWFTFEVRKAGIKGLERHATEIGDQGWVYRGRDGVGFTVVAWRYGRVFAGVAVTDLPPERALAFARIQQQRIVAALR